jgi:hypothetical protein
MMKTILLLLATASLAPAVFAEGVKVRLDAVPSYVDRLFVPVVPRAENTLTVESLRIDEVLSSPKGFAVRKSGRGIAIDAPAGEAAGYARVRAGQRELTLTLINLVPYTSMKNGRLDGYQVGEYEAVPLKGLETYERPKGFIRLTKGNGSLWVSDHYRLRDFQCKLDGAAKFLLLRTEALVKLEILQNELAKRHGLDFSKFTIMSGYRTPYYNARIGNETSYSRHLYGDAMDIYIDEDRNGKMDDVNRDGRVDAADARFILNVAESIDRSSEWGWLKGGAGVYHANRAHGPYIHVDARGYVARWGALN